VRELYGRVKKNFATQLAPFVTDVPIFRKKDAVDDGGLKDGVQPIWAGAPDLVGLMPDFINEGGNRTARKHEEPRTGVRYLDKPILVWGCEGIPTYETHRLSGTRLDRVWACDTIQPQPSEP